MQCYDSHKLDKCHDVTNLVMALKHVLKVIENSANEVRQYFCLHLCVLKTKTRKNMTSIIL